MFVHMASGNRFAREFPGFAFRILPNFTKFAT